MEIYKFDTQNVEIKRKRQNTPILSKSYSRDIVPPKNKNRRHLC